MPPDLKTERFVCSRPDEPPNKAMNLPAFLNRMSLLPPTVVRVAHDNTRGLLRHHHADLRVEILLHDEDFAERKGLAFGAGPFGFVGDKRRANLSASTFG